MSAPASKPPAGEIALTDREQQVLIGVDSRAAAIALAAQRGLLPRGGAANFTD